MNYENAPKFSIPGLVLKYRFDIASNLESAKLLPSKLRRNCRCYRCQSDMATDLELRTHRPGSLPLSIEIRAPRP